MTHFTCQISFIIKIMSLFGENLLDPFSFTMQPFSGQWEQGELGPHTRSRRSLSSPAVMPRRPGANMDFFESSDGKHYVLLAGTGVILLCCLIQ
jgi:hypothetical protein